MDNDLTTLSDFDIFFYYGQNDLETETKSDIMANLMQSKRSLFYNRDADASGVKEYENVPNGLTLQTLLPYNIVESLSKRNLVVSDGEGGSVDRRVATSQNIIDVNVDSKNGATAVNVFYISLADFKQHESLKINIGIGS